MDKGKGQKEEIRLRGTFETFVVCLSKILCRLLWKRTIFEYYLHVVD